MMRPLSRRVSIHCLCVTSFTAEVPGYGKFALCKRCRKPFFPAGEPECQTH